MTKPTEIKRWMRRLERCLKDTPEGVGIYTVGDAVLFIYDKEMVEEQGLDLYDGGADEALLGLVNSDTIRTPNTRNRRDC